MYYQASAELGAFKAKYANEQGEYMTDESGRIKSKEKSEWPGRWRIFQRGEEIGSFPGDWKPDAQSPNEEAPAKKEE